MSDSKPKPKPIQEVHLRSFPKVIFFYPLFFTSLILWIIQAVMGDPVNGLAYFWLGMFFVNLFVIAFDFSSTKFFVLILGIIVFVLLLIFLIIPAIPETAETPSIEFNVGLPANFYMACTLILGIILGFVILSSYFDYWKVERNEIYHKSGLFSQAERYPVKSLRIKKEIPDIFEFLALRAGSITLMPGKDEIIHLNTVLNINKKAEQIDYLLSHMHVEIDQLDKT
ncbi:MAG: hypothetical protein ACTSR8_06005 [Promethearchaeota archaeon]